MNPAIGECPCPMCGQKATVHKAKGRYVQPLYLRCGTIFAGPKSDGCGVNQARGPSAQAYIQNNTKFYESSDREKLNETAQAAAAEVVAEVVETARAEKAQQPKPEQPKPAPEKKTGGWSIFD